MSRVYARTDELCTALGYKFHVPATPATSWSDAKAKMLALLGGTPEDEEVIAAAMDLLKWGLGVDSDVMSAKKEELASAIYSNEVDPIFNQRNLLAAGVGAIAALYLKSFIEEL